MWLHFLRQNLARRIACHYAPAGPLRDLLSLPFPSPRLPCMEAELVAVDLETTGLNPKQDSILSIGLVHIQHGSIRLDTTWYQLIQVQHQIPEASVLFHQITDDRAALGLPLAEVLPMLLERLLGKIMLAHHAVIEQEFLNLACRRLYGAPLIIPTIDTLALMQRRYYAQDLPIRDGELRLFNLRKKYNLPRYRAHNALSDAVATAELFLAISAEWSGCRLRDFWN